MLTKIPTIALALGLIPGAAIASSHMDAPLITLDDAANTTDVYAFVTKDESDRRYLTTALAVYPFEDPGIGPNNHNFDDNVLYALHVSLGDDLRAGRPTISYYFEFKTRFKNRDTILQSFTDIICDVDDAAQNLTQEYTVTVVDRRLRGWSRKRLGKGIVPPNNQGRVTPEYNLDKGEGLAKDGVASLDLLDRYTQQTVTELRDGYVSFAGQRDDGFYADIQAIFDRLSLRGPGVAEDSQGGFNVHTIVLQIPISELGGDAQQVGVYATTSRRKVEVRFDNREPIKFGNFIQVGRQGNPLFCEGFIALRDKDRYNRMSPIVDKALFSKYALRPELARLLNAIVFAGSPIPGIETDRTDLAGIFIPDLIKVDLSTDVARLAGGGMTHPTNPDDVGFDRRSVFGGDQLFSPLQNMMVPGGWPNGRRFGDDVVDIAVSAAISDLRVNPPVIRTAGDNVDENDIAYNKVMPYAATPLNGRNHRHH